MEVLIDLKKPDDLSIEEFIFLQLIDLMEIDEKYISSLEDKGYVRIINNKILPTSKFSKGFNKTKDVNDIINHLSDELELDKRLQVNAVGNRKWCMSRLTEGYKVDDIKETISFKVKQWKNDSKMRGFLRLETLLGNKFSGYFTEMQLDKKTEKIERM